MNKVLGFFRHLFIPTETNNYRAKSLHTDFLAIYLIIAFFMSVVFKKVGLSNVLGFATDISATKLFQLTNQQREKDGLPDLKYNDKLACAAYQKAQDMFNKNYWAHFAPDGKTPWDFILNCGYNYEYAGENLAKNFLFSDGVVGAWMNSPSHRDNILKSNYTDVGFAVVNGVLNGEQTTLVVQMFGKPLTSPIAQQPKSSPPALVFNQEVKAAEQTPQSANLPVPINKTTNQQLVTANSAPKNAFSLPAITFDVNFIFFSFLLLALVLDFYFAARFHIVRISGKNLAHFIFIFFIIAGLLIIARGAII